ncbi:unnamed protein product [Brassica oleracea]
MVDFSEFVFFMYRENGHESISKIFCSFESLFWLPSARICCITTIEIMPKIHSLLYTVLALSSQMNLLSICTDEHHIDYCRCHTGLRSVPGLRRKNLKTMKKKYQKLNTLIRGQSPYLKRVRSDKCPRCSFKSYCVIGWNRSQRFASHC